MYKSSDEKYIFQGTFKNLFENFSNPLNLLCQGGLSHCPFDKGGSIVVFDTEDFRPIWGFQTSSKDLLVRYETKLKNWTAMNVIGFILIFIRRILTEQKC